MNHFKLHDLFVEKTKTNRKMITNDLQYEKNVRTLICQLLLLIHMKNNFNLLESEIISCIVSCF